MRRRSGPTLAASMPHGKVCCPARFREITGARTTPKHDPDHVLAAALEHARCKTGLGYHMWAEFIRDFPKARDQYKGAELERYDARRRGIYYSLKHRDGKYMASFALYLTDDCEAGMRSYAKRRKYDPNARRPRCTSPVLRQAASSCVIYGRGFWCRLSEAPRQPLLASPYVVLRFPVMPFRHVAEFRLSPYVVERLAGAVRVGAVTVSPTTVSIAYEPRPVAPAKPVGMMGMDVNKAEHVVADTDGSIRRIKNGALAYAEARREKHRTLGVTGGKPKQKRHRRGSSMPRHVKNPGRKPKNKSKRRDWRVNRTQRNRINTRYYNQKIDWLYKLMHSLAGRSMGLALERSTIDRLLVKRNRSMSGEQRDLLKMGLSQGTVIRIAREVFAKYGLPVPGVDPSGTSSDCPACDAKLWAPGYRSRSWNVWGRAKVCTACLYYVDRDDVAAINIVGRGVSAYEPAAIPGQPMQGNPGRRVVGDWEQGAPQLVHMLLGAAAIWFPYVGEGRRPKGSAKNPPCAGDARLLDDRLDVSNGTTGVGPPGEVLGGLC